MDTKTHEINVMVIAYEHEEGWKFHYIYVGTDGTCANFLLDTNFLRVDLFAREIATWAIIGAYFSNYFTDVKFDVGHLRIIKMPEHLQKQEQKNG